MTTNELNITKTFSRFTSRKDQTLTGFRAVDQGMTTTLLNDICTNSTTGYVRMVSDSVCVPSHAADAVEDHLVELGWAHAGRKFGGRP